MNKKPLLIINILTGLFVVLNSVIGYSISGIGESSTNNSILFVWVLIWAIGLILQFNAKLIFKGLLVTFIPVIYFIYLNATTFFL